MGLRKVSSQSNGRAKKLFYTFVDLNENQSLHRHTHTVKNIQEIHSNNGYGDMFQCVLCPCPSMWEDVPLAIFPLKLALFENDKVLGAV